MVPTFGNLRLDEGSALLQGLYEVDRLQFAQGLPPVSPALHTGRIRYIRNDPDEHWKTARELWRDGGGDCEDLAAAVAAERTELLGIPSRPLIYRVRPGLAHAVVWDLRTNHIFDPSVTGGMRRP